MPSASRPEGPADEVVQAFTGDTLEEAMASAVATLGPDLVVRRARKVRAGLSGLMGRERYEVLALPDPSAPADPALALQDAFDALLGEADAREAETAPYPARPEPARSEPARSEPGRDPGARTRPTGQGTAPASRAVAGTQPLPPPPTPARRRPTTGVPAAAAGLSRQPVPPPEDAAPERAGLRRSRNGSLAASAPHPGLDMLDHEAEAPRPRGLRRERPAAPPAPPLRTAPEAPPEPDLPEPAREEPPAPPRAAGPAAEPAPVLADEDGPAAPEPEPAPRGRGRRTPARRGGWSAAALQRLGVPSAVLEHLEAPRPADDLAWVAALARAIAAVVPDPAEPDDAHPVVLSGHGLAGTLAVLDAGTRGATPGTISYGGRTAPATATELALAVRHHLGGA